MPCVLIYLKSNWPTDISTNEKLDEMIAELEEFLLPV